MDKENPNENSQKRTRGKNYNDVFIHALRAESEDNNFNKKSQRSKFSGDYDSLRSYSSNVRSNDEEHNNDDDK